MRGLLGFILHSWCLATLFHKYQNYLSGRKVNKALPQIQGMSNAKYHLSLPPVLYFTFGKLIPEVIGVAIWSGWPHVLIFVSGL